MLFEVDFDKFVNQNRDPDIVVRRNNRRICRALALTGEQVYYPHQRTESHSVPDGTETYTDSEGKTHTRTRYTTVQVLMTYTNGVMRVTGKNKKAYARGFYATLSFSDGHGVAIAPHTGKHHQIRNSYVVCVARSSCWLPCPSVGPAEMDACACPHTQSSALWRMWCMVLLTLTCPPLWLCCVLGAAGTQ